MKRPILSRPLLALIACLLLLGCKRDEQTDENLLLGRWEIVDATRNGNKTETLDNLYFVFGEDGTLETNIAGSAETATYTVKDQIISQRESRMEANYQIETLNDSMLVLSTELRNYQFRFLLKRAGERAPAE